ncbi:PEF-CTERM sorting domain-containing protein [Methanolobus vulcani]|uniref:PEF-CTERM sorting domain-containing protein n=2 Tax=Methanolobus vulcani TaxID=38026 RepID=A0A7Z8P2B5_9EURY|nr:PEF-CTERM sorting domain-containing protein [Methanolobus vulcani]
MNAILVNGEVLTDSEYNCLFLTDKTLKIESADVFIQSIGISSGSPCVNKIKFDNLCYTQADIPEFPTIALPIAAIIGLAFIFRKRE